MYAICMHVQTYVCMFRQILLFNLTNIVVVNVIKSLEQTDIAQTLVKFESLIKFPLKAGSNL